MAHLFYHMAMPNPSLRQLDIFAQMMAAGSAARCAGDMGIGIDDVLGQIASLEMRLGFRLFDDPAGAATLTPAGRKTAQAMLSLTQDASPPAPAPAPLLDPAPRTALHDAPAPPPATPARQVVTLGAPAPVFGHFQDALAAFESSGDDVSIAIDLHVHSAQDAVQALASGRVDIAYFYALVEPAEPPSRYGWSEQISVYAGEAHPISRLDIVSRHALSITPMVAMEPHNPLRAIIDAALVQGDVTPPAPAMESDNMFDILTALRNGAGCFAAFGTLARDLGRMGGIRRLPLDRPLPTVQVRQAKRADAADFPAVDALADYLFR